MEKDIHYELLAKIEKEAQVKSDQNDFYKGQSFRNGYIMGAIKYAEQTASLRSQLEAIEKICITSGPLTAEEIVNKVAAIAQAALKE